MCAVAGAVNEALGAKVDTLTNEVPKVWAMNDCYCQLIECYDDAMPCYQFIPRIGAFEVTYQGVLLYSKLITKEWPHVPSVAKRLAECIKAAKNGTAQAELMAKFEVKHAKYTMEQ